MPQQAPPAFLNKFPAQAKPTPEGDPGPGFVREGAIDPGQDPSPVTPPKGLPGPIRPAPGWHVGPGTSVRNTGQSAYYGVPEGHQEQDTYSADDIASEHARMKAEQYADEMLLRAEAAAKAAQEAAEAVSDRAQKAAPGFLPKAAGYAALTALGFAVGRKFSPMMPVPMLRDSVPTAGALAGMSVASAFYKEYGGSLLKGLGLLGASVIGAYAADLLYPGPGEPDPQPKD